MSSKVGLDGNTKGTSLLTGQNQILEMIATGASLEVILVRLVLLIEAQVEGLICSVLLLEEGARLRHAAAPNLPEAYSKAIDGVQAGPKAGSCGTAAFRKQLVIVADILQDSLWEDYRDLASRHGLRACWSTPFFSGQGKVLGTFAMYYRSPRRPGPDETQLIDVATRIASIAVERWQGEWETRRIAESYRALVENLTDVVFSVDVHGKLSYVSPPIERLLACPSSEVVGKSLNQFVHPQDLPILRETMANTLAGSPSIGEFRMLDRAGGVHWCQCSSRLMANQLVGVTGVIVDITRQKATREALHTAVQKYRDIVEDAIVGIFQTDPRGHYVTANPALARMLGYESPEDLMSSVDDIPRQIYVDVERRSEFKALMERDGSVRNFECQVYRKNGSKVWLSAHARAIYQDGEIAAYEGMNEDITERKLLEEQLLQSQKMEAVGQLAGGIAHDFNNLLGVILGHGEMLLQEIRSADPMRRRIDQICQAGKPAVSLTEQLLAFSRRQILRPVVMDLNVVVQDVNDMIARLIGKGIRVINALDPTLGLVKADTGQIEQVLVNLAVNARDAMPQGGTLTLETSNIDIDRIAQRHSGAKEGRYVMLTVSDTGIGIDEKTLPRIFEPFFTTKEPGKGTGLGLATAYGIVKQSGGYISVSSEVGQGTTFRIYLPRTDESALIENQPDEMPSPKASKGETILLVEDAAALREITREFLEGFGYRVLEANSADLALKFAEEHRAPISLMITDVVMPGMNGRALAERLRVARPETKVLYVSGYADDAAFSEATFQPGTDFLHKPYSRDELIGRLRRLLDAVT